MHEYESRLRVYNIKASVAKYSKYDEYGNSLVPYFPLEEIAEEPFIGENGVKNTPDIRAPAIAYFMVMFTTNLMKKIVLVTNSLSLALKLLDSRTFMTGTFRSNRQMPQRITKILRPDESVFMRRQD
ncbi:Hypothetical predicted protein [Mytilus galloprovincialis]|uniref:Uncharacterized protein n=1 Tax=Mytilus galloprovincialis TaxID=29158 RepID=A0A8B6H6J8_MYTGA|nr:Hypothetical predicted protein [Mytilus galloprovincialis]